MTAVALEDMGDAAPETVDRLLAEHAFPLVEGANCTFVWRGDADAVAVEHRVVGLPAPVPLERAGATDLWYATLELPRQARFEYRFLVRRGDHVESVLDPLNPRTAHDPMSEKSVLETDGYVTPDWAVPDPAVVPGELVSLRMPSRWLRRDVALTLYLPVGVRQRGPLPLLVVHDGGDYLRFAGIATVLDNLMHRGLMAGAVAALIDPADRLVEYAASPRHARFLTSELVPRLEQRLPLRADPAGRVLMGASMGAIASLSAAARAPGFYGGLLLQSGTFMFGPAPRGAGGRELAPVVRFLNGLRADPREVSERIFLSIGAFEPSAGRNRAMAATLRTMAGTLRVEEGLDGHNWFSWRDRMLGGLGWLLPDSAS